MYKDVTEEFVVNVIKTQTKMIAQIHKELLKIFSSSGNDDLITACQRSIRYSQRNGGEIVCQS